MDVTLMDTGSYIWLLIIFFALIMIYNMWDDL
jgi:hypothetical protein